MSVKKSLAWMATAQAVAFVTQFASSVVLARYLTPHQTGIFAVGVAIVGIISIVQQLGLSALIVREEVLTPDIAATAFTINAAISALLSLLTAAAAFLGANFFRDPAVRDVLLVLAISPLFGIPSFLPGAMLEREGQFRKISAVTTLVAIFNAVATVVLAILNFSYMSMAYAQVLSSAALSLFLVVWGYDHFSMRVGLGSWRRVLYFGTQMLAVAGVSNLSLRTNDILLGRLLGLASLGLYNRANGLNNMLWGNIHHLISRVVLVDFASINRAGEPLGPRYLRTVAMITALLWPAFAGLAVVAKPFIVAVYGAKWAAAAMPLTWLAIASMILVSITMTWEVFTATGNLATQTRIEVIKAPVSLALFAGGCAFGLEGAAFSRVLDAMFAIVLYRRHLQRMTNTTFSQLVPLYGQSAAATLVAVGPSTLLLAFYDHDSPLVALAGTILLGVVFWILILVKLNHPIAQEVLETVHNRLSARRARARASSQHKR